MKKERTISDKTIDSITYSGASVAIATMVVYIFITYIKELAPIKEVIIAGLTPLINGMVVFVKNKYLTKI